MAVNVTPLPHWARDLPEWLRPLPHPIFDSDDPTPEDRALAEALIDALDDESRRWYGRFLNHD